MAQNLETPARTQPQPTAELTAETHSSWGFEVGDPIAPGLVALKLLGGGRRYEVYLAIEERRLTVVVAKVIRPAFVEHASAARDLAAEAEVLDSLAHPGLPRLLDAAVDGGRPHLLLEQIDGPTLRRVVRRHGVSIDQVVPLALHLCSVLHYLGTEKIVHLDVKPSNVVMAAPPRLIDLSVARRLDGAHPPRPGLGTPPYMAPEQCLADGFGPIGTAADIWGLGVTLYEAVVGRRPFADEGVNPDSWVVLPRDSELPPQARHAPAPLPEWVPDVLAELITACLEWDPALRPTPYELALSLEALVADVSKSPRLWGRGRRTGAMPTV